MNYGNYLRDMTKKFHGNFIDYDVYTGTWTFKVKFLFKNIRFNKKISF